MKNQVGLIGIDRIIVKIMAHVARNIAKSSVQTRCFFLIHQPEEPKDLEKRLDAMQVK